MTSTGFVLKRVSAAQAVPASDGSEVLVWVDTNGVLQTTLASGSTIAPGSVNAFEVIFDGGGSEIADNTKLDIQVPCKCTITEVTMLADQTGSIVIDIWKDTYLNYPPTDGDSITAALVPTITTAVSNSYTSALAAWSTLTLNEGDCLRFNVDSCTTITRCTLIIKVRLS